MLGLEHLALAFLGHSLNQHINCYIFYCFNTVSSGENPKDLQSNWEFSSVQSADTQYTHACYCGRIARLLCHIIRQCVLNYASLVDHIHEFHKLPLINHTT